MRIGIRFFPFATALLLIVHSAEASPELKLPPMEAEEKSSCADKGTEEETKAACKRYDDMESEFGANSWTQREKKYCRKFFEAVHRIRSLVCSYKKEVDQVPANISTVAAGANAGQANVLARTSAANETARKMHEKYRGLLFSRRAYLAWSYQEFKNQLKADAAMLPRNLLTEEANCKGGASGIKQTHVRVTAEIKLKAKHLEKVFPFIRKATNDSIRYAEEEIKAFGIVEDATAKAARRLAEPEVPTAGGLDETAEAPEAEHPHNDLAQHAVQEVLVDRAADRTVGATRFSRYTGLVGAVACVSIHLMMEGQISPRALMAESLGIVSMPLGFTAVMLVAAIEQQEKKEAYYRAWGSKEAKNNLLQVNTKSPAISKEFCEHLEEEEKEAQEKRRQEIQARADEMRARVERNRQMEQERQSIYRAPRADQERLIQEYRRRWNLSN